MFQPGREMQKSSTVKNKLSDPVRLVMDKPQIGLLRLYRRKEIQSRALVIKGPS